MTNENKPARRVFLGMPGYGGHAASGGRGLWRASRGLDAKIPLEVDHCYHDGSLLAHGFNIFWTNALNACHRGKKIDYFAMLHSDIEVDDFWLDALVEELEAKGLDVLSAVVPLKHPKGLTSVAMDHPSGDPFRYLGRLTMQEIFQLPETFTAEDVGHPLLLNTGCWVCRFDYDWARSGVCFTINDRIVFNRSLGMYQTEVEPEDWNFSRQCNKAHARLGATRKIKLNHVGNHRFPNHQPWGEAFDSEWLHESVLPSLMPEGVKFPQDVDGWLLPDEGRALAELARGKRVLEIGSYCGRSTICMAQTADSVVAVDTFDGRGTPKPRGTLGEFRSNIERYGLTEKVLIWQGTIADIDPTVTIATRTPRGVSTEELPTLGEFGLIFIDGAHDLESVQNDIRHALPLLAPDGVLAFHDYRESAGQHDGRWDPGVTQAVQELIAAGGEILSTHSTVAVVKPPLPLLETSHGF